MIKRPNNCKQYAILIFMMKLMIKTIIFQIFVILLETK